MYTDRAGQCAAMPGGSGSLESTGTVFKLQCTDPEQPTGKMPPAPKGTVKYEPAGTGFGLPQKTGETAHSVAKDFVRNAHHTVFFPRAAGSCQIQSSKMYAVRIL